MDEQTRRLLATAAKAMRQAEIDSHFRCGYDEYGFGSKAEHFEKLAKDATPMDSKELEYYATFH